MTIPSGVPLPTVSALQRVMAGFLAALIASVWPLWGWEPASLVQIPWFSELTGVPGWVDRIGLAVLLVSMVILAGPRRFSRGQTWGRLLLVVSLGLLVLLDQHRFQPWVCQFLLMGTALLIAPDQVGLSCSRAIVISIYLWSAISKLDMAFLNSHGQLLLNGLLHPLGIETTYWSPRIKTWLPLLFPAGELLTAFCLSLRSWRQIGLMASVVMHLLLLWTLGWGLGHEWSVLIWNGYFLVQNLILFRPPGQYSIVTVELMPNSVSSFRHRLAVGGTILAVSYPALELVGYCDHWPAWAVYSSRPALVTILLDEAAVSNLPEDLRPFLGTPLPLTDEIPFRLDAWSFQTCGCPVYPQLRYRLALAGALLESLSPDAWQVEIRFTPRRWTGERKELHLRGRDQIREYCRTFWANTLPRQPGKNPVEQAGASDPN